MSNILNFQSRETPLKALVEHGPAEIIIFPGVRYERLDRDIPTAENSPPLKRIGAPVKRQG